MSKLVRDKIPEIIKATGKNPKFYIANEQEYETRLSQKLQEEVLEFLHAKNTEELADILEVVYALGSQLKISPVQLENIRRKKAEERGAFSKKIILEQ